MVFLVGIAQIWVLCLAIECKTPIEKRLIESWEGLTFIETPQNVRLRQPCASNT
jgi:hypothetical protein